MPRHPPCALCILTFWYSLSQHIALYWALLFYFGSHFSMRLDVWLIISDYHCYNVQFSRYSGCISHCINQTLGLSNHGYIFFIIWQPPTLPYRLQYSTIGRSRLNHRVRDENGCDPWPHRHQKLWTLGEVFSNLVWMFSFSLNEALSSLVRKFTFSLGEVLSNLVKIVFPC